MLKLTKLPHVNMNTTTRLVIDCTRWEKQWFYHKDLVSLSGYDISEDPYEFTPLTRAFDRNNLVSVKALVKAGIRLNDTGECIWTYACAYKSGEVMKFFIEHGYDVNQYCHCEGTALHGVARNAVFRNDTTCLELFMKAGAKERVVPFDPLLCEERGAPSQHLKKEVEEMIADGYPPVAGALERALHVLATVRPDGKEENERIKDEAVRK